MMHMGWGFPWPVLMVPVMVVVAIVVMMVLRSGLGTRGTGPGGFGTRRSGGGAANPPRSLAGEDPLVTMRERYARGEIDTEEFERRLESLLRSKPAEATRGSKR